MLKKLPHAYRLNIRTSGEYALMKLVLLIRFWNFVIDFISAGRVLWQV